MDFEDQKNLNYDNNFDGSLFEFTLLYFREKI